jgi:hypothetical protein
MVFIMGECALLIIDHLNILEIVVVRVVAFTKMLGTHGAVVVGHGCTQLQRRIRF